MVTDGRFDCFRRSFLSYCGQRYKNKELIIVTCGSHDYKRQLREYVLSSQRQDVLCVFAEERMSLGALRNLALMQASGPLICQWDDDDYSHPLRLLVQVGIMTEAHAEASYLRDNLHFFCDSRQLFWCDWLSSAKHIGLPGTLLAYKSVVPSYNELLDRREDSEVQNALRSKTRVAILGGIGYLYLYNYHGTNVFQRSHHAGLVAAYGLEAPTIINKRGILSKALEAYRDWLEPWAVVTDALGTPVFRWTPESRVSEAEQRIAIRCNVRIFGPGSNGAVSRPHETKHASLTAKVS
jgi:glycosyltransferase involved in cell wall biosynthesis